MLSILVLIIVGCLTASPVLAAEKVSYDFEANTNRLLDILVHSLYSDRDVFLRELISNGADALDKRRFVSIQSQDADDVDPSAQEVPYEITIIPEPETRLLRIRDTGIGMNETELRTNLGVISHSGTAAFLEDKLKDAKGSQLDLIGQFGVGFYSAFLISDHVQVVSKKSVSAVPWVWESTGTGQYSVFKASGDVEGDVDVDGDGSSSDLAAGLTRGTEIRIHVKEGAEEYLEEAKIKELVKTYSEFINFPIKLNDTVLNEAKALWLRDPKEVTKEEHDGFFQAMTKYPGPPPMAYSHFSAEGDVEFKAVLYIPSVLPPDFYDMFQTAKASLKLYVKRVFISDSLQDLVPKWLGFLVGVVDSDSLPLNVSREVLQASGGIKVIKKKVVRKAIDMIKKIAADEDQEKYEKFWEMYGKAIKAGVIESDESNRRRLLPLLRFQTSWSIKTDADGNPNANLTTFDEYVSRMKDDQTSIYYLVGSNIDELKRSPFVEMLDRQGREVILLDDPIDEYVTAHVTEYEGKELSNVSKDNLDVEKPSKKAAAYYKDLGKWWKTQVDDLSSVRVSNRLASAPCVVVSGKYGWSATMEKIAKLQALADPGRAAMMKNQRILEINPRHPLIQEIRKRWEQDPDDASLVSNAKLLYQTCLLNSGFLLEAGEISTHNHRILQLLGSDLKVDVSAMVDEIEYPDVAVAANEEASVKADDADIGGKADVESMADAESIDVKDEL